MDKTGKHIKEYLRKLPSILYDILSYSWRYSLYLTFGILFSQMLNILGYKVVEATTTTTWFNLISQILDILGYKVAWFNWIFGIYNPSVEFVEFLSLIMALFVFFSCSVLLYILRSSKVEQILTGGILISIIFCTISQLIFSSIMRLIYEFSFCLIVFASVIIYRTFIQSIQGSLSQNQKWRIYQDLWELLKILIPICIGFPTVMGGVDLIYKGESLLWTYPRHLLMVRHILMAGYFEVGAAFFLIIPILKTIFHMRRNL